MNLLWHKESGKPDAIYVDCFENIDVEFAEEVTDWLLSKSKRVTKGNQNWSNVTLTEQNGRGRKRKWREIAEGSENIGFGNSSEKIVRDSASTPSKRPKNIKRGKSSNAAKSGGIQTFVPNLDFQSHPQFTEMADVLQIEENEKYGRHIIANSSIDVGKIVIASKPFARVCISSAKQPYCLTCQSTENILVPCVVCKEVWFCNEKCEEANQTHWLECNSVFHKIDNSDVKLAIEMSMIAISYFSANIDQLMNYFEILRLKLDQNTYLGLVFNLTMTPHDDETPVLRAYRAFKCLMSLRKIKVMFNTKRKQRFLMHMILHNVLVIPTNSFQYQPESNPKLTVKNIFGVVSLLNHSCASNCIYEKKGDIGYCITIRPIQKGDQIFINYLGDRTVESTEKRQYNTEKRWNFRCDCERCLESNENHQTDLKSLRNHPSFQYFKKNYKDHLLPFRSKRRNELCQACINLMTKFGHVWSQELDNIISLFIAAFTD